MIKYIDAEAFFVLINTLPYKDTSYPDASAYNGAISDVADMLTHFPAADVVEVRHGRMVIEPDATVMHCNVCGWAYQYYAGLEEEWNYCPNCGSRMDLEGDTE